MAWEWSHTDEAYAHAETALRMLPPVDLRIIWAEWRAHAAASDAENPHGSHDGFDNEAYERNLRAAAELADDVLADDIWQRASDLATCDNGGFRAWMCPYGCGCHTVKFSDDAE